MSKSSDGKAKQQMAKQTSFHGEDDKENAVGHQDGSSERTQSTSPVRKQSVPLSSQSRMKPPATPALKLGLKELIESADNSRNGNNAESPEGRVTWGYDKNAVPSPALHSSRKRKRARSSSPISSPGRASAHFSKGSASDTKRLELSIIEPGTELWGRFDQNSQAKITPIGRSKTSIDHLLQTSSPKQARDIGTPRGQNKLRRVSSCGNQWPSNKRRKLVATEELVREDVLGESPRAESSKGFMVNALIEKVVLPRCDEPEPPPIQSSPPPVDQVVTGADVGFDIGVGSQTRAEKPAEQGKIAAVYEEESEATTTPVVADGDESDYGDFDDIDLDDEVFMAIETTTAQPIAPTRPAIPSSPSTLPVEDNSGDSDEFGDFDEEAFDICASKLDTQMPGKEQETVTSDELEDKRPPSIKKSIVESDDEFGDIDDEDFEILEAAASQGFAGSMPVVCTQSP